MAQVKTRIVPVEKIMSNSEFLRGFNEYHRGLPFSKENGRGFSYDRGRQFAIIWGKKSYRQGRGLKRNAVLLMRQALNSKEIL